jgi:hypothetical protein
MGAHLAGRANRGKLMKSEVEAAIEQLDWAIRLFLDHKAYVAAIPLAAAAEKILGKAVGDRDSSADRRTVHVEFDEEAVQYIVSRAGESRPYAQ